MDDVHHAKVFMIEDVAMENESADIVSTEVDADFDVGIRVSSVTVPVGNFDHIEILAEDGGSGRISIDFEIVLRLHKEMHLVKMEFVIFEGMVFDGPFLDGALGGGDRWRRVGIKDLLRLACDDHEKLRWLNFVEIDEAFRGDGGGG